jgi:hypothetical protein
MENGLEYAVEAPSFEFVDIAKVVIAEETTPERVMILRETFRALSDEAREFMRVVLDAPERLYLLNGKLKKRAFQRYCRNKYGWSSTQVEELKFELGFYCQMALLRRR